MLNQKSTPAQRAIDKKMASLIAEVEQPFTNVDMEALKKLLSTVKRDTLWGPAIVNVFKENGDVRKLIDQLASQAIDDFVTMSEIVGFDATLLLLRYFDSQNPN